MARASDTMIAINFIDYRAEKAQVKDGNGDPMENALSVARISDLTRASTFGLHAILLVQAAPTTGSGTRYAGLTPGSLATDIVNGKLYIKTSAVGATDTWAVVGTQT